MPYERAFSSDKHFRFEDNYVKIYIDNYDMTDVTVAFLADMAGFSDVSQFSRFYKERRGVAPIRSKKSRKD